MNNGDEWYVNKQGEERHCRKYVRQLWHWFLERFQTWPLFHGKERGNNEEPTT